MSLLHYLPRRRLGLAIWLLVGLIAITGLVVLFGQLAAWRPLLGSGNLVACDFSARGNLVAWFSSMSLAMAGVVSLAIYSVRQHRMDDYRGCFTVWLWASGCFWLASLDATAGLHQLVMGVCVHLAGTELGGDGSLWWIAAYALVFGPLAARLAFELCPSRVSLLALAAAGTAFLLAAAFQLDHALWGLAPAAAGRLAIILRTASFLLGTWLVLVCLVAYARFVFSDALGETGGDSGEVATVRFPGGQAESPPTATAAAQPAAAAAAPGPPRPRGNRDRTADEPKAAPAADARAAGPRLHRAGPDETPTADRQPGSRASDDGSQEVVAKLSRAERKRLKKEKRQQRHVA
jgi:hypothetical protein